MRISPVINYCYTTKESIPAKKSCPITSSSHKADSLSMSFCAYPHLNSVSYAEARELMSKKHEESRKYLNSIGIENCPKPEIKISKSKKSYAFYEYETNTININHNFFKEKGLYILTNKKGNPMFFEDETGHPLLVFCEGLKGLNINEEKKYHKHYLTRQEALAYLSMILIHEFQHYKQNIVMLQDKNIKNKIIDIMDMNGDECELSHDKKLIALKDCGPFFHDYTPEKFQDIDLNFYDLRNGKQYSITQDDVLNSLCEAEISSLEADANLEMYEYTNSLLETEYPAISSKLADIFLDFAEAAYVNEMDNFLAETNYQKA